MSGSNAYSPARDLTHKQPAIGSGSDTRLFYLCGHKGMRSGALMKGFTPWKCADCAKGKA